MILLAKRKLGLPDRLARLAEATAKRARTSHFAPTKEEPLALAHRIPEHGNRVLIIGDRGREHALAIACARSPRVEVVFAAPGNPGIHGEDKCVTIPIGIRDTRALVEFAKSEKITLAIPGTENAIATGIVNLLETAGIPAFAPRFGDAWYELSKVRMKRFAEGHGIPTAPFVISENFASATHHIEERSQGKGLPCVVKADGLRDGKGVEICHTQTHALEASERWLTHGPIVIEDKLDGDEVLFTSLVGPGGRVDLPEAEDHKAANDDDTGPMTGGILTFSPPRGFTRQMREVIVDKIVRPTHGALMPTYQGVLSFGIMYTAEGPKLLEFGVRFGCPEAEAILSRFEGDFFDLIVSVMQGRPIPKENWKWSDQHSAVVALCNPGYPGHYKNGSIITGIEKANAYPGVKVFHSGTLAKDGKLVTAGGRLLHVRALGQDTNIALSMALEATKEIHIAGGFWHRSGSIAQTGRPKKRVRATT